MRPVLCRGQELGFCSLPVAFSGSALPCPCDNTAASVLQVFWSDVLGGVAVILALMVLEVSAEHCCVRVPWSRGGSRAKWMTKAKQIWARRRKTVLLWPGELWEWYSGEEGAQRKGGEKKNWEIELKLPREYLG
uniref:Uncharacterized protein n=1 Tax=Athene cunicularia TaxID=194338 RepID=A0A663NDA1_ATHCN